VSASPDVVIRHEPAGCAACGAALPGRPVAGAERRQVTGLPPDIRALLTEHQMNRPALRLLDGHRRPRAGWGDRAGPVLDNRS
jgi:hypothetical protein